MEGSHSFEVATGQRFEFGANWARFLRVVNDDRIALAEQSLRDMLGVLDLRDLTFLDAGSGSGLFSLAARRLGATVHSFDFDPQSVECTRRLKRRFRPDDPLWITDEGSVLDRDYLSRLGQFDVVYSWGVLHHTGAMWKALENVAERVKPRGRLFVALYNDQGRRSRTWRRVKKAYCASPHLLRPPIAILAFVRLWGPTMARDLLSGDPTRTFRSYGAGAGGRGMSPWTNVLDWVGGYPFEVARPEDVFRFLRDRRFALDELKTCGGGLGCNEFVFTRR